MRNDESCLPPEIQLSVKQIEIQELEIQGYQAVPTGPTAIGLARITRDLLPPEPNCINGLRNAD
jgi:hypothetical protein